MGIVIDEPRKHALTCAGYKDEFINYILLYFYCTQNKNIFVRNLPCHLVLHMNVDKVNPTKYSNENVNYLKFFFSKYLK